MLTRPVNEKSIILACAAQAKLNSTQAKLNFENRSYVTEYNFPINLKTITKWEQQAAYFRKKNLPGGLDFQLWFAFIVVNLVPILHSLFWWTILHLAPGVFYKSSVTKWHYDELNAKCDFRTVFNWVSKVISWLLLFCTATLCDWLKNLMPLSRPIRSKTKTNHD